MPHPSKILVPLPVAQPSALPVLEPHAEEPELHELHATRVAARP